MQGFQHNQNFSKPEEFATIKSRRAQQMLAHDMPPKLDLKTPKTFNSGIEHDIEIQTQYLNDHNVHRKQPRNQNFNVINHL